MPTLTELQTPLTRAEVRETLLAYLADLTFPVEAWQATAAARGFVEICAAMGASLSSVVATLAKMPFLSTAVKSFLTALAKSHFDEDRTGAIATVISVTVVNSSSTSYSTIPAGQFVVQDVNGVIFANSTALFMSAGSTNVLEFAAQIPGASGNIAPGTLQLVTPFAGVTATFGGTFVTVGADEESDPSLQEKCTSKWGTLRVDKVSDGLYYLARAAAPNVHGVSVVADNPRGPGTVDVYLAAENASAGGSDVTAVQAAFDAAIFGNGSGASETYVKAFAAPTTTQDLAATVYVRGTTAAAAQEALEAAWRAFLVTIPVGGFDLTPGPTHVVQVGQIVDALAEVPGVVSVSLATPSADLTVPAQTKVLEGAISFTIVVLAS